MRRRFIINKKGKAMTVYIEYVLVNNTIIDYCILKAAFTAAGKRVKKGRLLYCSVFAAALSLVFPLLNFNKIIVALLKIAAGLIIMLVSAKFYTKKEFYVCAVLFFAFTFAFLGAMIGISALVGYDFSSSPFVSLSFIPVFIIYKAFTGAIKFFYRRKNIEKSKVKAVLLSGEVAVTSDGFIDSGNGVYDGDSPVIFCTEETGKKLISTFPLPKIKKIKIKTVSGEKELPAIKLDCVKIYFNDNPNIYNDVTACFSKDIKGQGYDVILHPDLEPSEATQSGIKVTANISEHNRFLPKNDKNEKKEIKNETDRKVKKVS